MAYQVFGHRRAGSVIVEMVLSETGLDYEVTDVSLDSDAHRDAAFAAINPQRKLPALAMPDGSLMTESAAIALVLQARHPASGLLPPVESADYGQALRWLLFVASEIYPIVEINDRPERFLADPGQDPEAMRELSRRIWQERWLVVENEALGEGPYLLGETFSLVDIYIAVVSRWAQQESWRPTHIPKVEALTQTVADRPACKEIWGRHFG